MRRRSNNKFGARKTVVDGHSFDSRGEAERFCELQMMQRAGLIADLRIQPRFELQPAFRRGGRNVRAIAYTADFTYTEAGRTVVEDFKGAKETEAFGLRKRLFLKLHPGVVFRVTRKGEAHDEWLPDGNNNNGDNGND